MAWRRQEYENYTVVAPEDEWVMHDRLVWERNIDGVQEYRCDCSCEPRVILDYHQLIIVHNSFDGREGVEWANEILNQ